MKSSSIAIFSSHPTLQLLERCKTFGNLRQVHAQLLVTGLALHTYPLSRLLFVSSSSSPPAHTLCIFNQIPNPTIFLFNTVISCFANHTNRTHTLHLFHEMQRNANVRPNEVTLVAVIGACSNLGALGQGAWAHRLVLKSGLNLNRYVGTALIEMYSKSGRVDFARQVFDQLPHRDTLCYNAMIGGFAMHGNGLQALELCEKMELEGLAPDNVTFVFAMSACSHSGLVEQGQKIFQSIKQVYGIKPTVEHYGCVVNLLIRNGRLNEAKERVKDMPVKPNAVIWRSLLAGARIHGDLQLGEMALKQLLQLEPQKSGNYALLSNMYASTNKWEEVKKVREAMKEAGIIKFPGSSLVEIGGTMHEFITGDRTHPCSTDVFAMVEEMNMRLQEHGHNPNTREVLFDIEEEEKEDDPSYTARGWRLHSLCRWPMKVVRMLLL
ncbi:unnamed protein product [Linum tenue]|uniref:Pentatricopeptide repeat-containing protein n=1 Tax=Linum tenue TaxID=586396 RepID=A0AAV0P525_9ROSI|nr:unnamed protein product [Linum tenue]